MASGILFCDTSSAVTVRSAPGAVVALGAIITNKREMTTVQVHLKGNRQGRRDFADKPISSCDARKRKVFWAVRTCMAELLGTGVSDKMLCMLEATTATNDPILCAKAERSTQTDDVIQLSRPDRAHLRRVWQTPRCSECKNEVRAPHVQQARGTW